MRTCYVIGFFLVFVLYVASYTLDVRRGQGGFIARFVGHFEEGERFPISASYRTGGQLAEKLYSPILFLDRRVRPEYWTVTFHPNSGFVLGNNTLSPK